MRHPQNQRAFGEGELRVWSYRHPQCLHRQRWRPGAASDVAANHPERDPSAGDRLVHLHQRPCAGRRRSLAVESGGQLGPDIAIPAPEYAWRYDYKVPYQDAAAGAYGPDNGLFREFVVRSRLSSAMPPGLAGAGAGSAAFPARKGSAESMRTWRSGFPDPDARTNRKPAPACASPGMTPPRRPDTGAPTPQNSRKSRTT